MEECSCVLWFFRALEDLVDKPSCVKKIFCDRVYGGNEMTLRKGWLSKPRHWPQQHFWFSTNDKASTRCKINSMRSIPVSNQALEHLSASLPFSLTLRKEQDMRIKYCFPLSAVKAMFEPSPSLEQKAATQILTDCLSSRPYGPLARVRTVDLFSFHCISRPNNHGDVWWDGWVRSPLQGSVLVHPLDC